MQSKEKCRNTKQVGHGSVVECGDYEWSPGGRKYYCESCLREKVAEAYIAGGVSSGAQKDKARQRLEGSEFAEFLDL